MDAHYHANVRGPVLLARAFAEQLPADKKGLIVNLLDQKVFNLNPDPRNEVTYTNRDRIVVQELDGLCAPLPLQPPPA